MSDLPFTGDTTLVDRYTALAIDRVRIEREISDVLIQLGWHKDLLQAEVPSSKPAILQSELVGFVRVMLGLMDVKYQHAILGPDRVLNGGGPETPDKPERPEGRDRPERPDGVPQELIARDRRNCDTVIGGIRGSQMSPEEKQRGIDRVEAHHRECIANAASCLP